MTIGNPAFGITLYLTSVYFRGELQHVNHVGGQKIKWRTIRTREIVGVRLQEELYVKIRTQDHKMCRTPDKKCSDT